MMEQDAVELGGPRYGRKDGKAAHRWGKTEGKIGFHGGKVSLTRPRVRAHVPGQKMVLPSWEAAQSIGPFQAAHDEPDVDQCLDPAVWPVPVRLPEGDIPAAACSRRVEVGGVASVRGVVGGTDEAVDGDRPVEAGPAVVIQIDGIHIENDLVLLAAVGIDGDGVKHPLGALEGATENAAVVQALLDNLVERGLDPKVCRLFIIDGSKALRKAIRRTFGQAHADPALSRCTRGATSWSACRSICMRRCGGRCVRRGNWMMP